ncbi:MAG: hypothetical protein ABSG53_27810, partial [Thermoguttaceae bacterium]
MFLVVTCPILFGSVGGLVVMSLNRFAPDYYRGVFAHVDHGNASNLGIGIIQGVGFGLLVGIVVAASLGCFRQLRPAPSARALTIIAAFGIAFAVAGTLAGYGLGIIVPGYYCGVFSSLKRPNINPVDVGIG